MSGPLWQPSEERIQSANLTRFIEDEVTGRWGYAPKDYADLHKWSVEEKEKFWQSIWSFCDVRAETQGDVVLSDGDRMPGAKWFPEARLSYAENMLRRRDDSVAMIFQGENRFSKEVSSRAVYQLVSRVAQALEAAGVKEGDRVAGYLPNLPEAAAIMLACNAIGAIWSSCSPDFGANGVVDRFGQIEPKILFVADGYFYNGKHITTLDKAEEAVARLPSVEKIVVLTYIYLIPPSIEHIPNAERFSDFITPHQPKDIAFKQLPFDHPLYILYSSGTTGVPKCIVHGQGGTLLQHLKEHRLHTDVKPGDRLFYFTTLGWMMWNWLISGLGSEATLVLYDGSPFHPDGEALFDLAESRKITQFGASAKFIDAVKKAGLHLSKTHDLSSVRTMLSTGSPLVAESFDYVYEEVKSDICLSSISGGTDIVSCFVLGNPAGPVWRGEIQALGLGMDVDVYDPEGNPVRGDKGELVCASPFPSMPVAFWNDPDGAKYRAAYFERFPGIWCHGDYAEITEHGGMVIYGRSDAVLNPGGVRIGTAEIYRQVEQMDEVEEGLAIGQDWDGDVRVVLFVRLREGAALDDDLTDRIRKRIRENCSPRHVPARVLQVADIPRTKSGKIVELAVREVVHGRPIKNIEALANPEALDLFRDRAELTA